MINNIRGLFYSSDSNNSLNGLDSLDRDNYEDCRIELRSHNLVKKIFMKINSIFFIHHIFFSNFFFFSIFNF